MAVQALTERVKLAPMVQQKGNSKSRPFCAAVIPYQKSTRICWDKKGWQAQISK